MDTPQVHQERPFTCSMCEAYESIVKPCTRVQTCECPNSCRDVIGTWIGSLSKEFNSLNKISVHMSMQWLRTHTKGCALYRVTLHTKMVGTSTIASVGVRDNHITYSLTHFFGTCLYRSPLGQGWFSVEGSINIFIDTVVWITHAGVYCVASALGMWDAIVRAIENIWYATIYSYNIYIHCKKCSVI